MSVVFKKFASRAVRPMTAAGPLPDACPVPAPTDNSRRRWGNLPDEMMGR